MSAHTRSLRNTLTSVALVVAALATAAAVTVGVLTTLLHRATVAIEASTESVRLAEEAEIGLILHAQARDPIVQRDLGGNMRRRLLKAREHVSSSVVGTRLREAEALVDEYLEASRDPAQQGKALSALHAAAYSALEDYVSIHVADVRREIQLADRIDYAANIGGMSFAVLIIALSSFFIYWVRGPAFRPIFDVAHAMERFGRGERSARANVTGFRELQEMAQCFNEMAAEIDRQRTQQHAFLAGIAHDLRTPIQVLLLSTNAARADSSLPPDHRARRTLERNARQLTRLDRMVGDFLDAARIEAGELELRFEERDMRETLRGTVELFEDLSPRHTLELTLPSESVMARFDPLRIEQVAGNLISNAIKYSPQGGKVQIRLERCGAELLLEVNDEGIGMSPEAQTRIFEPFRRASPERGIPGAGLGLFVVRRIVDAHRGRIEVVSALGAGSSFRVFLAA